MIAATKRSSAVFRNLAAIFACAPPYRLFSNIHRRILSGIQPTGSLHLGNYLGAVKNWVALQDKYSAPGDDKEKLLYMIADLHAITVKSKPEVLMSQKLEMASALLACGIDPAKSTIFVQSEVPHHSELAWILTCLTPQSVLHLMTQYKDKVAKAKGNSDSVMLGLLSYPVLMAADILLYKSTHIPVGDDQTQHLELARRLVRLFNNMYGEFFPAPEPIFSNSTRVMSLGNGLSKMSKSDRSESSRINLTDTEDLISRKVKKAKTDSYPGVTREIFDPGTNGMVSRPECTNLLLIHSSLSGIPLSQLESQYASSSKGDFKSDLTSIMISNICPIGKEIQRLQSSPEFVLASLEAGRQEATAIASENMKEIKRLAGLGPLHA